MPTTISSRRKRRRTAALAADPFLEVSESVALLEQATEANQRQINDLAIGTQNSIRDVLNLVKEQGATLSTEIKQIATQFSASQRTNWPLLLSVFLAIGMLVGAAYKISDLQTQVTMAPVVAKAEISERDRASLSTEIASLVGKVSKVDTDRKIISTKLAEVETQFRASDESRNVQFAEQQRTNNLMAQFAQGAGKDGHPIQYPQAPYYFPHISDHNSAPEENEPQF